MMERTEPTFVPEWLKNSDDKSGSRFLRNKSLDSHLGRPTTSSYFRRPFSSSNGSTHLRSYSSFGRTRDRNKEKSENWNRDYSDSLANILPSWFEKDGVRRSRSNVSAKRVEFDSGRVTLVSATANVATGRNMAETLAQGYPRAQTASQLSVGTQRLEELAVKQSRQLIPMTPSMPKSLSLNSSDKPKTKFGGPLQSPRTVSVNADVMTSASPSSSTVGKLHVLKPSRERNNTAHIKETSSPTNGSKLLNSPLATTEKRPSPQAKSRNDFFNLMRKKSMANNSSALVSMNTCSTELANGTVGESGTRCFGENKVVMYSEEEEARFLRSLGWEETTEEEGLTEEEINSFYRDVSKYVNLKTGSSFLKGIQPKCLMPLMGENGDTKVES